MYISQSNYIAVQNAKLAEERWNELKGQVTEDTFKEAQAASEVVSSRTASDTHRDLRNKYARDLERLEAESLGVPKPKPRHTEPDFQKPSTSGYKSKDTKKKPPKKDSKSGGKGGKNKSSRGKPTLKDFMDLFR